MGMLGDTIGMMRAEALYRAVIGTLWFIVAAPLFGIWFMIGVVLAAIDVVWQFIFNSEGIMPMNLHREAYSWFVDNVYWLIYGSGEFDPLPYV